MPTAPPASWSSSLHQSYRLLDQPTKSLPVFLQSDGQTQDQVLAALPYDAARARTPGTLPDPKRFRDPRLVFSTVGLVYMDGDVLRVTDLGRAVGRWLPVLRASNAAVLGRHAAYALAVCQLRNPLSQSGRGYSPSTQVFPFRFIWQAALALDGRISSEELNRVVFWTTSEVELQQGIERIREFRKAQPGQQTLDDGLGPRAFTTEPINDRVIPWVSLASFGWVLMRDKQDGFYSIRPELRRVLREAAQIKRPHREFADPAEYVRHISDAACLPKDVR